MEDESNELKAKVFFRAMTRARDSTLQEQLLERDSIIRLYETINEENLKRIEKLKTTIKEQKETIQNLTNELNDKEEKMSSVNLLVEKIKSLESEKQFLKQRINVLISAQSSSGTTKSSLTPRTQKTSLAEDSSGQHSKNNSTFSKLSSSVLNKQEPPSSPSTSSSLQAPLLKLTSTQNSKSLIRPPAMSSYLPSYHHPDAS